MDKRTLEIIAICKGNTRYDSELCLVDAVKNYMSDRCMYEKRWYTYGQIENVLKEVFYDFIDVCDRPSYFLRQLEELKWISPNLADRICMVLQETQVVEGHLYINGFDANYKNIVENLQ